MKNNKISETPIDRAAKVSRKFTSTVVELFNYQSNKPTSIHLFNTFTSLTLNCLVIQLVISTKTDKKFRLI